MKTLTIIVFIVISANIFACDCNDDEPSVEAIYQKSSYIFTGKVLSVENSPVYKEYGSQKFYYQEITVEITESFKGDSSKFVTVINEGFTNCGTHFQIGEEYLIYPFQSSQFKAFVVHQCHKRIGTTLNTKEEILELRKLKEENGG